MEDNIDIRWRKSSYSGNGGSDCVEVGDDTRCVLVRDTQDRTGLVLRFAPDAWRRFADRLKQSLVPDPNRVSAVPTSSPAWCPFFREGLHLAQHQLSRGRLGVRRVAVLGEQPFDGRAELGPHVIP